MSSISGSIKFAGLGSGTDFTSIVESMKKQQEMPKTRLEYWKADWQKRYDAFDELLTSITTLNSTLKNFNSINKLMSKACSSSTEAVAKAVAKADAPEGAHTLEVSQLATNAVVTNSTVYKDKTTVVTPDADATFSYTYKGKSYDVKIPKGSSAQLMVDQINKQASAEKVNVKANLIKTGDGYVFQIQGSETGVKNDLTINGKTNVPNFTPKTLRSTVGYSSANAYMGDLFGPDGLKFSYGKVPDPLPDGKTAADYVTDFNIKPTVDNTIQTSSRYKDKNSALNEPISFTYNGKEYVYSNQTDKSFVTDVAYGDKDPLTAPISFSYNGKDYDIVPDGTKTLADARAEIGKIAGKDVSISLVPEMNADGTKETGKHFLKVTANKVATTVHEDPMYYASSTTPITEEIRFTTPDGRELVFPADGTRNLDEIVKSINEDTELGLEASVVTGEGGKKSLKVIKREYAEDGIEARAGGENPPVSIGEVVSAINGDTPSTGLSAKLVMTETGYTMRVTGKEGGTFEYGEATIPPVLGPDDPVPPPGTVYKDFETANRTLQEVVDEINATGNPKGVFAGTYTNADGKVCLELRGNDPTAFTYPNDKFEHHGPPENTWSKRAALDARYRVDGLGFEFTSSKNELTDVLPGLTVTLLDVGKTTITTTTDTSKVEENVQGFVDGVNELLQKFQEFTKFDKDKDVADAVKKNEDKSWKSSFATSQLALEKGGTLTGNYGVMLLNSQIKQMVSGIGTGFRIPKTKDDDIDKYYSLGSIGIVMDPDQSSATFGQLIIREPKLNDEGDVIEDESLPTLSDALEKDPLAVAQLLAGSGGVSDMGGVEFQNQLDGVTKPGTYDVKYSVDEGGTIGDVYIGGVRAQRVDADSNSYSLMSGPGQGMTININDLTPGDYSGTVRIKQGKVPQLTELLDYQVRNDPAKLGANAKRGTLQVLKENYKTIMENIDKKIENEEKRISQWEKRMNLKFSRLDTLLGQYNMKSQANQAALAGMPEIQ